MDAALRVVREKPAIMAASSKFKGFGTEPLHEIRKMIVGSSPILEKLQKAWEACDLIYEIPEKRLNMKEYHEDIDFNATAHSNPVFSPEKSYDAISQRKDLRGISGKDIQAFSIALERFQGEEKFSTKAGLFLSALINNSRDVDVVIHTAHLTEQIGWLGYHNTKNIIVEGDIGDSLGSSMESGSITVDGSAGDFLGSWMKGGSITVKGDAGEEPGFQMFEGKIIVEGNSGNSVGSFMIGGSISVGGNAGDRVGQSMTGGSVIVEGSAGDNLGNSMKGGAITVRGDADDRTGNRMEGGIISVGNAEQIGMDMYGGEIHVLGDRFSASEYAKRGKIFHKGELVFSK